MRPACPRIEEEMGHLRGPGREHAHVTSESAHITSHWEETSRRFQEAEVGLKAQDGGGWQVKRPGVMGAGIRDRVRIFSFFTLSIGTHTVNKIWVNLNVC